MQRDSARQSFRFVTAVQNVSRAARRAAFEHLERRRLLSAGSADGSFDGDGVRTDEIDGFDFGAGVAVQADGTIVALVNTDSGPKMARYDASGTPVGLPIDLAPFGFDSAIALAVAPGNKLVVAGDQFTGGGDIRVAQFNSLTAAPEWSVSFDVGLETLLGVATLDAAHAVS